MIIQINPMIIQISPVIIQISPVIIQIIPVIVKTISRIHTDSIRPAIRLPHIFYGIKTLVPSTT